MLLGFIGGGGASGILYLLLAIVFVVFFLSVALLGLILLYRKRKITAILSALVMAVVMYFGAHYVFRELGKSRNRGDATIGVVLSSNGGYSLIVDGTSNRDPLVLISADVDFSVTLPDSRKLEGGGTEFQLSSDGGFLNSIEIGGVDLTREEKLGFLSGLDSRSGGKAFDGQTDDYSLRFRQHHSDYHWFTITRIPN